MMDSFYMNGHGWSIKVEAHDSPMLVDRTGHARLAVTDPRTFTVYLSEAIPSDILPRVLTHELGHCAIYSFGLAYDIHKMVQQEYWIEAEEWVCNFIADYWLMMFQMLRDYLGEKAWNAVPKAIETAIVNRQPYTIYRR